MSEPSGNPSPPVDPGGGELATTSKTAIASVVLGCLSLVFSCLAGLPGVILAIIALVQINKSKGLLRGSGLAVTGLLLSVMLSMVTLVIGVLIGMLLPAVESVRDAERRTEEANRIRQLGEAAHEVHDQTKRLPSESEQPPQAPR